MSMWIISRGVVLLILLMEYKVLRDFLLHRSSINNSARLSNKFGGFYFSFKFDISGLLHHVITTIAYRIRGGSLLALKCLVWFMKYYANVRRTVADFSHAPLNEYSPSPDDKKQWSLGCWFGGKLIQKLRQKGVYEESFSRHAAWIGGKLIQFMHTTMVPVQVKTMKIQAGIQVSRPRELTRQLQLWKTLFLLYLYMIGTLSGPSGFELSGVNLQSGVEKQDLITNIEDSVLYPGIVSLGFSRGRRKEKTRRNGILNEEKTQVEAPNVTSFHVTATRALTKLLSCRTLRFCSYDSDTQNAIEDHGTVSPYGVTSSGGRLIRHIYVATLLMYIFSLLLCL
ncbi:hypothetical protein Tco_1523188 [Tanacetum coccineum]